VVRDGVVTGYMDMSDPAVQAMLEEDKQEALARIRAARAAVPTPNKVTAGCAKCGTEDTGRFTDGDDVCLDCRSTQPDEKSPCCHADVVWAAELVPFMDWHLVCSECQDLWVEPTKGGHMAVDGEPYFPLPISFTTGCDVCNDGGNCRCT